MLRPAVALPAHRGPIDVGEFGGKSGRFVPSPRAVTQQYLAAVDGLEPALLLCGLGSAMLFTAVVVLVIVLIFVQQQKLLFVLRLIWCRGRVNRSGRGSVGWRTVCFQIIRNLETMHD